MTAALLDRPEVGYQHPTTPWNGLTVTDLFCGAGGSSSGLVEAGYRVVIAANHWAKAIESHQINHPDTDHAQADISQVDPRYFPRTDVLWASPECTNHSIAKGVKRHRAEQDALFELAGTRRQDDEAANRSRATMWDVPRFAEAHQYRAIIIENVVDAYRWVQYPAWILAMELLGYEHQTVWLNSMHAQQGGLPAPQSRDRMYIVFWRKDAKRRPDLARWTSPQAVCVEHGEVRAVQAFKKAERWGRYRAQYVYRCPKCGRVIEPAWLPALSIIDWSIPAPRIGDREKPLAEKTRERIRKGIERYWAPLVVKAAGNTYDGVTTGSNYLRVSELTSPLPVQTGSAEHGMAFPPLAVPVEGRDGKAATSAGDPLRTQSTRNETALLVPAGGTWREGAYSGELPMASLTTREADALVVPLRNHGVTKSAREPIDTVAANGNHHALVLTNTHGNRARPVDEPLPTATTATTMALLMRNNTARGDQGQMSTPVGEPMRALTTAGHQSLISPIEPISLDVDDAGFRMLEPHEIQLGMGFAADYHLVGSKRDKVKQAGNAVTPPVARDLGLAVAAFLNRAEVAA